METALNLYGIGIIFSFFVVVLVILPRATEPDSVWNLDSFTSKYDSESLIGVMYVLVFLLIVMCSWITFIVFLVWKINLIIINKLNSKNYKSNVILPRGYNKIIVLLDLKGKPEGLAEFLSEALFMEELELLEIITLSNGRKDALFAMPELEGRDLDPEHLPTNFRYLKDIVNDKVEFKFYPKRVKDYLKQEY